YSPMRRILNQRMVRTGIQQQWAMKRNILSSRYTTRYEDLLQVK
ncbi:DUF4113 domain-containing protein, partial [Salmonella enterica]|nr:DUF4113 domain-containing protein [Salmonella enterica]